MTRHYWHETLQKSMNRTVAQQYATSLKQSYGGGQPLQGHFIPHYNKTKIKINWGWLRENHNLLDFCNTSTPPVTWNDVQLSFQK